MSQKKKRMIICLTGIWVLISIVMGACSRTQDYELVVINQTDFTIDVFKIDTHPRAVELSINPRDTSDTVVYRYKSAVIDLAEPLLGLSVDSYSDSLNTYQNKYGQVTSIPDLLKNNVNTIYIHLKDTTVYKEYIFEITVNK
jgi:hypothetical protein